MKTKLFLLASLISTGLIFTACQKNNELTPDSSFEQSAPASNAAFIQKNELPGSSVIDDRISLSNWPDPFYTTTSINFKLKRRTSVRLYVHEVRTGKVIFLFEGVRPAGSHSVTFDASDMMPGEFVAELITHTYTEKDVMTKIEKDGSVIKE